MVCLSVLHNSSSVKHDVREQSLLRLGIKRHVMIKPISGNRKKSLLSYYFKFDSRKGLSETVLTVIIHYVFEKSDWLPAASLYVHRPQWKAELVIEA